MKVPAPRTMRVLPPRRILSRALSWGPRWAALSTSLSGVCLVALALVSGCAQTAERGQAAEALLQTEGSPDASKGGSKAKAGGTDEDAKAAKKRKDKIRTKTREVEQKERSLHVAQLELKVAKRGADQAAAERAWKVARAAADLEQAERALGVYEEVEKPLLLEERALQLQRAERYLRNARQDLEGILAIYVDEPEASAKEEIIERYQTDVSFAERDLALRKQRNAHAERSTDVERQRSLDDAVLKAQRAVERERSEKEHSRVQGELELMRKEHALVKIEEELQDLRNALRKLKKAPSQ